MDIEELANKIIGLAIKVHSALGPGLLESAYKECFFYEIVKAGFYAEIEKPIPLVYEEVKLDIGYRVDILVENILVVETKAIESFTNVHIAQTLTYLKLGHFKLGLLMNFNVKLLKDGIKRVIN
jgi:GxxExxY protein